MLNAARTPAAREPAIDLGIFFTVIFLLIAAFLKDDALTSGYDAATVAMVTHPLVSQLKNYSPYIFGPLLVILFSYELFIKNFLRFKYDFISIIFIMMASYIAFRVAIQYPESAAKYAAGLFIVFAICSYIASCRLRLKPETIVFSMSMAFAYFGLVVVALNLLTYVSGYGYLGRNARFFGTSIHPNFMGVQLAIAEIALFSFWMRGGIFWRAVGVTSMLACLFLVVLTGSRTALIIVMFAGYGAFWQNLGGRAKLIVGIGIVGLVVVALGADTFMAMKVYDRGSDINTRSEAWSYLLDRVSEETLFGFGKMEGYSENSILRGWAAFGVLAPLLLLLGTFLTAYHYAGTSRVAPDRRAFLQIFKGLFWGVLAGSILEGYLFDTFSVGWLSFLIACVLSSEVPSMAANSRARVTGLFQGNTISPGLTANGALWSARGGRQIPRS